ncbi:MAG: BatD family protein, partial [Candidatus Coatesbacteria bacterium]
MTVLAGLLLAAAASAADLQVSASVDRTQVVVGEPFRWTIVATGASSDVPDPRIPQVAGLEIYGAGRAQQVSIVNGQVSSSITFQFQVVARGPGRLVVPSAAFIVGGKTYATDPIAVTAGSQTSPSPNPSGSAAAAPAAPAVFVSAAVNKRRVYVGEQLVYTFLFHTRVQLASSPGFSVPPDLSGFVFEDLPPRQWTQESGYVRMGKQYALFPTAPGTATIGAATLQVAVLQGGADPFAMFLGGGRTQALRSEPVNVTVLPLPDAGRPADFTGVVGSYRLDASLDKSTVEAGKPVTLTVEIKGSGLIKSLREPAWPEIPGARRYETLTSLNVRNTGDVIQGSKTFKVMLIPLTSGRMAIPAIRYPVFDPEARRYVALATRPLALTVKAGPAGAAAGPSMPGLVPAAGLRTLNQDIRFLKAEAGLAPARSPLPARPLFAWLQLLPLLFAGSGAAAAWRRAALARDPAAGPSMPGLVPAAGLRTL